MPFNTVEFPIVAQYALQASRMFCEAQHVLNDIPFGTEGREKEVAKLEESRCVLRAITDRINEMKESRHENPEEDASLGE
jgi:hypothetical protein